MTEQEASIIIENMPIVPDDCYGASEYQEAKAMAISAMLTVQKIPEVLEKLERLKKNCETSANHYAATIKGYDRYSHDLAASTYEKAILLIKELRKFVHESAD